MTDVTVLADRFAIEELFARYARTIDGYDAAGWVGCFAADGIFEVQSGGAGVRFVGQQALHEFATAHIRLLPGTRHVMTNHEIEFDGNRARHCCTLTGALSRPEKVYTFVSGWYDSLLEKIDGHWQIKHRTAYVDNGATFTDGELATHMQPLMTWIADNGTVA